MCQADGGGGTHLSFGQQQRLVRFIPKERRVIELQEDKAGNHKRQVHEGYGTGGQSSLKL